MWNDERSQSRKKEKLTYRPLPLSAGKEKLITMITKNAKSCREDTARVRLLAWKERKGGISGLPPSRQ